MATRLYLHAALNTWTGVPAATQSTRVASWTATGGASLKTMNTTIGTVQASIAGTSLANVAVQYGLVGMWRSDMLQPGQSINAQSLVVNVADAENNLSANAWVNSCNVYLWNVFSGTKTVLYDAVGAGTVQGGTEATAINSEQVSTYTTGAAVGSTATSQLGDVIVVELWVQHTQAAAAAYVVTTYLDGTTETLVENTVVTSHASFVEFAQTLTFDTNPLTQVAITNNVGTGAVQTFASSFAKEFTPSGVQATEGIGTLYVSPILTGNEATGQISIPYINLNAITGNEATTGVGSVSTTPVAQILGNEATNGVGTITAVLTLNALTGVEGLAQAGDLPETNTHTLSGNAGTGAAGTPTTIITVGITGVYGTGAVQSLDDGVSTGSLYKQALKEAYASAPTDTVILHTLEFRHPNFVDDVGTPTALRVVRDWVDLTANLEANAPVNPGQSVLFIAYAFDFQLPETSSSAAPEIVITIDNVSRIIEQNLERAILSPFPIEVTYRPYLSTDLTGPQMNPPLTMILKSVETSDLSITARAGFPDLTNKAFPAQDYSATTFPGLIR